MFSKFQVSSKLRTRFLVGLRLFLMSFAFFLVFCGAIFFSPQKAKATAGGDIPVRNFTVYGQVDIHTKQCFERVAWDKPDLSDYRKAEGGANTSLITYMYYFDGVEQSREKLSFDTTTGYISRAPCDSKHLFSVETFYNGVSAGTNYFTWTLKGIYAESTGNSGSCPPKAEAVVDTRNTSPTVVFKLWAAPKSDTCPIGYGRGEATILTVEPGNLKTKEITSPTIWEMLDGVKINSQTTYTITTLNKISNPAGFVTLTINPNEAGTKFTGPNKELPSVPEPAIAKLAISIAGDKTSPTGVNLSWDNVNKACTGASSTKYEVYDKNGGTSTLLGTGTVKDENNVVFGHTPSSFDKTKTYLYQVRAVCEYTTGGTQTKESWSNKQKYNPPPSAGGDATTEDEGGGSTGGAGGGGGGGGGTTTDPKDTLCDNMCPKPAWWNPIDQIWKAVCQLQCMILGWVLGTLQWIMDSMFVSSLAL